VVEAYPSPAETLRRFTQREKPAGCCSALAVEKHEKAFPRAGQKVGGAGAPVDIDTGQRTQSWLAVSNEPAASVSGRYWHHWPS
jgi:hypothetical protein